MLVMGLGLLMMGIGLEKKPIPGILMEGNVLLNKWAVLVMGSGLPMVTGLGLNWSPVQTLLMEGLMLPMPAILMAQVHVRLAHLAASILKKKISKPLIFIIH